MNKLLFHALAVVPLISFAAPSDCVAATRTCRNGDVCACEACAKDPIFGRWAADLPSEKFDPAVWFAFSRDGGGRPHVSMLWRWGILQYPETISYAGGVFAFRQPLKGPPASLKGANRYVQRRETHFKWFFCSLVDNDHLKVEMKDLNYWAQPITGTKVDLGSFVCTRIPPPGPEPDLDKAVYGEPIDLLANGLADWEEDQKGNRLPNQWSFKDGVLSTAHKLTPAGGWVAGCNLRTRKADYGDCKISFDFRLPELSNSGVWLRGNFEINVCDSYGWAIDNRNSGVLCGLFEPLVSAEKKFGEWQHIDCWFVNRHCTIILNGKVTMDNAPVYGVTGGARNSNVNSLGPIILQGDHSGCDFRNMVLTPILSCHGADGLPTWSGDALRNGWGHNQCALSYGSEGLTADSRGRDPFIVTPRFDLDKPSNLHEVVFRAKTTVGGLGELFYSRPGDRAAPQALAQPFTWIGDGEWHEYRIRPFWGGQPKVVSLRIDMPADPKVKTTISSVAIVSSGDKMSVLGTAVPGVGAAFTVPPQDRTVWANIEWIGSNDSFVKVREHLHLIGDGKERRYFFDAKSCVGWNANYPYPNQRDKWRGDILMFRVVNAKTGEVLPIKDLEFCTKRPELPAELILSHTKIPLELDRAGRGVNVEVGVFNVGTVAATGVTCRVSGLPSGVRIVNPEKAGSLCPLGGGDSVLHTVTVVVEKPCAFTARLEFAGGNAQTAVAEVPVKIGPSLNLPQNLPYIPEPKPLKAGPCEVGAFYFLDWARTHHWLKIWRTAPERRPAAGWYANDNPELLDWQIKWAVENGISFYLLDWYNSEGYFQKAIKKARFSKHIKWAVMWCNHIPSPGCDEAHWTAVIKKCLDTVFNQPQYMFVNGMPYMSVWDGNGLERDNGKGGCKRMLEKARAMARAAGYKGIYFQAQCGYRPDEVKRMAEFGFDETTTYHYIGTGGRPDSKPRVRDFADVAASSYDYWKSVWGVGGIDFLPNLSTGWDDRPWHDGLEVRGRTVEHFRRICRDARRFAEETGVKRVCLAPLHEWGEGSYAEPNGEFGFGMFEAVRDAFCEKPAEGWPMNYTPADIGRGPYPVADEDGGPVKPYGGLQWR